MSRVESPLTVWKTEAQIRERVQTLAAEIRARHSGGPLHVLGILRGCFVFMADLIRALDLDVHCHFINVHFQDTPRREEDIREVERAIVYPELDVAGKNLLIVGEVFDTGVVIDHVLGNLGVQRARSVRLVALIDRPDKRRVDLRADYALFEVTGGEHIFGYGLDDQDRFRHLPFLARRP